MEELRERLFKVPWCWNADMVIKSFFGKRPRGIALTQRNLVTTSCNARLAW